MKMINGISEQKWDRLIDHLISLEILTERKLISKRRFGPAACPIENYAPANDKDGLRLISCSGKGNAFYGLDGRVMTKYAIYTEEDSLWWTTLKLKTRIEINLAIKKWIEDRQND